MSRYKSRYRYDRYSMFPQSKSKSERIADAARQQQALAKKREKLSPVVLQGFAIASTFWGKSWCKNIESYHDYANRLPRGRSYVRSNSVIDLQIAPGAIQARVMGTSLYRIAINIRPVAKARWQQICSDCTGKIGSLIELLQGQISNEVMAVMTDRDKGLFPQPSEISFTCSCPDSAGMCKHIAAVMYGIGSRLDTQPELLFFLRGADSADLIATIGDAPTGVGAPVEEALVAEELAGVFGVDIDATDTRAPAAAPVQAKPARPATAKAASARPAKAGTRRGKTGASRAGGSQEKPAVAKPQAVDATPSDGAIPKRPRGRPRKAAAAATSAAEPSVRPAPVAKPEPRAPKAKTRSGKSRQA
jgi:uncharacterized Zn finger protein